MLKFGLRAHQKPYKYYVINFQVFKLIVNQYQTKRKSIEYFLYEKYTLN
jgi:hypothetical protein